MPIDLFDYLEEHISQPSPILKKIERDSNLHQINGRMCSGSLQGRLLKMLTEMISPLRVLEIGTFTGYSALCIAEGLKPEATLDTIEIDDELEDTIRKNLDNHPSGKKITLHIGDSLKIMGKWSDRFFDLVFIDGDKREYPLYLEAALRLLKPGGYIIADNTLWDGHVIETSRHSAHTESIMKFNDLVALNPKLEKVIIPLRDGLTLIRLLS